MGPINPVLTRKASVLTEVQVDLRLRVLCALRAPGHLRICSCKRIRVEGLGLRP